MTEASANAPHALIRLVSYPWRSYADCCCGFRAKAWLPSTAVKRVFAHAEEVAVRGW